MSLQHLVVNFNWEAVRSVYVKDIGECLVASDVWNAVDNENCRKAFQRLVPEKYKMRLGDAFDKGESVPLHQDTVLLKEPGLYYFLLTCVGSEAFMEWVCEEVLPQAVRKLG